jgi:hypothetical protein
MKPKARRFLGGLSADELQYIAEFLGAWILEAAGPCGCSRTQLAERLASLPNGQAECSHCHARDRDHKSILLLEFLRRSGLQQPSPAGLGVN